MTANAHPGLAAVRARIAAACARVGRSTSDVRLVAVTKGRSHDEVAALLAAGQRDLGENRVQAYQKVASAFAEPDLRWHLVGHLQRNKVRFCRGFTLIHSLDSERLALALEAEGAKHGHVFHTLLQLNVSGEASKHGLAPSELAPLLASVRDLEHVQVEGLMTMAPYDPDPERARPVFRALRALALEHGLEQLSMGMSGDLEVAVEEGATLVRVGSALFEPAQVLTTAAQPGSGAGSSTDT